LKGYEGRSIFLGLLRVKIGKFMGLYDAGQNNHKNHTTKLGQN
jgi:hypothetical protein